MGLYTLLHSDMGLNWFLQRVVHLVEAESNGKGWGRCGVVWPEYRRGSSPAPPWEPSILQLSRNEHSLHNRDDNLAGEGEARDPAATDNEWQDYKWEDNGIPFWVENAFLETMQFAGCF